MLARHPSEVYKRRLLPADCPRRGDIAEVIRDHHNDETGLLVHVVNDPHYCMQHCANCGTAVSDYFVEVECDRWPKSAGPFYFPISWLKRISYVEIMRTTA